MTSPARKPRQTGLQTWLERRVDERWVRNYDRQHELSRDPVLRVMVKPDRRHALPEGADLGDFHFRAIVREEIAANGIATGPIFREDPIAAIQFALDHEAQLAPVREEVLRALARSRSDSPKDTF